MSDNSDLMKVVRNAETQGFRVSRTNKGHWQFYAPNRHDIIVTAGTPGDHRGWQNFLSEMRRSGYQETTTPLGEKIEEARAAAAAEESKELQPTIRELVVEILSRHPLGMATDEINAAVRSKRPNLGNNSVHTVIHYLRERGDLVKMGYGRYRLVNGQDAEPALQGAPTVLPAPPPAPVQVLSPQLGYEKDLLELDEALAALARIETVVRRNREILVQFAKLKEAMASVLP